MYGRASRYLLAFTSSIAWSFNTVVPICFTSAASWARAAAGNTAAAQAAVIIFISRVLNLILYRDCKSLPKNVFFGMV